MECKRAVQGCNTPSFCAAEGKCAQESIALVAPEIPYRESPIIEKKNRLYESMTKGTVGAFMVRVWCSSPLFMMGPDAAIRALLTSLDARTHFTKPWREGVEANLERFGHEDIGRMIEEVGGERVTAYEIVDRAGNGAICYPDWK